MSAGNVPGPQSGYGADRRGPPANRKLRRNTGSRDLRSTGIDFWLDKWEIKVGNSIVEKTQDALEAQDFLIVVLSPESVSSAWVKKELSASFVRELEDRQVVILPVLYRNTQIPIVLRDKLYADFTVNYTTGMETLLKRLSRSDRGRERKSLPIL